jgi:hypothetical protein
MSNDYYMVFIFHDKYFTDADVPDSNRNFMIKIMLIASSAVRISL